MSSEDKHHSTSESDDKPEPKPSMILKLYVNKTSSMVLFAEADKGFVDFLFSFLVMPLGTITKLLKDNKGMVGSIGELYESVKGLDNTHVQTKNSKEALLCAKVTMSTDVKDVPDLLDCDGIAYAKTEMFSCTRNNRCMFVSGYPWSCPSCGQTMNTALIYVDPSSCVFASEGFVRAVATYMVMDDLAVKPMSTKSCFSLLNDLNIKDIGLVQEMSVTLDKAEGLKLLQASLTSKTVLTDAFLRKTDA